MGIEGYGGCCPKCNRGMLQKWESSSYGLLFDACPWCGFLYGTGGYGEKITEEEKPDLWNEIIERHGFKKREDFTKDEKFPEFPTEEESDFYPSVFDYSKQIG